MSVGLSVIVGRELTEGLSEPTNVGYKLFEGDMLGILLGILLGISDGFSAGATEGSVDKTIDGKAEGLEVNPAPTTRTSDG